MPLRGWALRTGSLTLLQYTSCFVFAIEDGSAQLLALAAVPDACCHACCMLPCLPAMLDSHPYRTISPNKPFLFYIALAMVSCPRQVPTRQACPRVNEQKSW